MNHAAEIWLWDRLVGTVVRWNEFAEAAGVAEDWREGIGRQLA